MVCHDHDSSEKVTHPVIGVIVILFSKVLHVFKQLEFQSSHRAFQGSVLPPFRRFDFLWKNRIEPSEGGWIFERVEGLIGPLKKTQWLGEV